MSLLAYSPQSFSVSKLLEGRKDTFKSLSQGLINWDFADNLLPLPTSLNTKEGASAFTG